MLYLQLFWEFFKTGLFAVGGGLATLPFLQDMADRTGWFTRPQLADMLAVSESTLPVSYTHLRVNAAFYGLRPASTALVAAAGISVVPIALLHSGMTGLIALNWPAIALAAVLLVCTNWVPVVKKWHPIVFIGISALVGVLLKF